MAQLKDLTVNGNLTVNNLSTGGKLDKTLLDLIYPIGTIYWNEFDFDINKEFGGDWEKIEGKFLLSEGGNVPRENPTGEIALTVNQLPRHNHKLKPEGTISSHTHNIKHTHTYDISVQEGPHGLTIESGGGEILNKGDHWHAYTYVGTRGGASDGYWGGQRAMWNNTSQKTSSWGGEHTHTIPSHTHTIPNTNHSHKFDKTNSIALNTANASPKFSGNPNLTEYEDNSAFKNNKINIMPPYVAKYCWRRKG